MSNTLTNVLSKNKKEMKHISTNINECQNKTKKAKQNKKQNENNKKQKTNEIRSPAYCHFNFKIEQGKGTKPFSFKYS